MSILTAVRRLVDDERLGAMATCVEGPATGARAVIDAAEGIVAGSLPEEISADVVADAEDAMANEQSRTLSYGDHRVFIATVAPEPVLVIFGAGHASQALARFAKALGYRIVVVDARSQWATAQRFPDVDELIVGWPDAYFDHAEFDSRTYVAIMNHDERFEAPVLARLHGSPVKYIGAMGSRRTHRTRIERLRSEGWDQGEIVRIHGPIGLDIGAETPEEIAISIVAEMTRVRYGHSSDVVRGADRR